MYRIIYFSGTGNTKILASKLALELNVEAHSIEEDIDWDAYIYHTDCVILFYPIYYSMPPMIFRDFIENHYNAFHDKKVVSFVTQMCFSGDGARKIEDYLPDDCKVVHTKHFNMPSNIPNMPFVPLSSEAGRLKKIKKACRKLEKEADLLKEREWKRNSASSFSSKLGNLQRKDVEEKEKKLVEKVWIDESCIGCGICVNLCPKNNLELRDGKAVAKGNCTLCLRCENACPQKAIRVLIDKPFEKQYTVKGIVEKLK